MTKTDRDLLFLALGGSGEIGMNVTLYGSRGRWLMVDMGVTFAGLDYPGVDLILPDLAFIEDRRDALDGIVVTHGHEDHIGALPYLAADLGVPLYCTPFTAGLVAAKLAEEGLTDSVIVKVVPLDARLTIGAFDVTFVPMAHSIAEPSALVIRTDAGSVFHSGDWKLDDSPVVGRPSDEAALRAIGDEGIDVLVCDSTNVFNAEASGSEASVFDGLRAAVEGSPGRAIVTSFASNVARLTTLGRVARETGRTLCVAGRSLDRILKVAQATGYLNDFPRTVDLETAADLPPAELMVIATGGQGEARAALGRMASGSHPIRLSADDTVIFSSKQIPGNEVAIGLIMNQLAARGVRTITEKQAHIHVSGHPGQPELAKLYEWLRPAMIVPVHGEMRHLLAHARFAEARGVPEQLVQTNGDICRLLPGPAKVVDRIEAGRLVLDGDVILPADGATMTERRRLAEGGHVSIALNPGGRQSAPRAVAQYRGLPVEEERQDLIDALIDSAERAAKSGGRGDMERLREQVRVSVRRTATEWTGKKPIVDVLILPG